MENTRALKMPIETIRSLINVEREWENKQQTNSYAYALGLDIPEEKIKRYAYTPGNLSNCEIDLSHYNSFTYELLMYNIAHDLEALGIKAKEVLPEEEVEEDAWKIALFYTGYKSNICDYHFLRQLKDGTWTHKNGSKIYTRDDFFRIIKSPETCFLMGRHYDKCLSLKLR